MPTFWVAADLQSLATRKSRIERALECGRRNTARITQDWNIASPLRKARTNLAAASRGWHGWGATLYRQGSEILLAIFAAQPLQSRLYLANPFRTKERA
jgi:hypothetical protein